MKCFVEQQKPFVPGIWGNLQLTSQRLAQQKVESNTFLLHTYFFRLQFSYLTASWFPNSSCFFPCASIYFCFCRISKESFQRCYSTDSSALRDQFLSSDFSRMADPVSRGSDLLTTGQRYHTSTFTWKASGSWVIFDEHMTGWVAKKHCSSWRRQVLRCERLLGETKSGLVGVFKNMNNTAVSQNSLSHSMESVDFLVTSIQFLRHPHSLESNPLSSFLFDCITLQCAMCPASCGDFSPWKLQVKHRRPAEFLRSLGKSQSFSRVFLWSLQSLHFNFFNAMDVGGCWSTLVHKEVNWILQRCAATWATFVQDFWPDVTWLSWKFEPSLLPFAKGHVWRSAHGFDFRFSSFNQRPALCFGFCIRRSFCRLGNKG